MEEVAGTHGFLETNSMIDMEDAHRAERYCFASNPMDWFQLPLSSAFLYSPSN